MEFTNLLESDKRSRSIVISGLEERQNGLSPSARQRNLEDEAVRVSDAADVECRPVETYRMGKPNSKHPRLVKVVLPSRSHWRRVLANARRCWVAEGLHTSEHDRGGEKTGYELRQEAHERNKSSGLREWVVYHGQLKRAAELPHKRSGNH
uniref:Uncharacterized protein n=1 Tax=Haemonchus contortus TaxID=6289 RepID=W6NCL7_HAECO